MLYKTTYKCYNNFSQNSHQSETDKEMLSLFLCKPLNSLICNRTLPLLHNCQVLIGWEHSTNKRLKEGSMFRFGGVFMNLEYEKHHDRFYDSLTFPN